MPYRRLPKTDAARLKALKTLLDNDDVYVVRNRFIDWQIINRARPVYAKLFTAYEQSRLSRTTQARHNARITKLQRNAMMYVSHFLQVLFMSVERKEIKRADLKLYGLEETARTIPDIYTAEGLIAWGQKVIDGEKARIKKGGRAIYNPTIGMVGTHYDIFRDIYIQHSMYSDRTQRAQTAVKELRQEADEIILELWNQIEEHYAAEPPEVRYAECSRFGVVYYNRRNEGGGKVRNEK